jgi:hypothetical protein
MVGTGLIWLRIGTMEGFCEHSHEPFGFHEIMGNS